MENTYSSGTQESNVDTSMPKLVAIYIVNILSAGFLGYVTKLIITDGGVSAGNILIATLVSFAFLSLFLLQALFVKSMKTQGLLVLLETLALAAPFIFFWSWTFMLAVALLLFFLMNAIRSGMKEMDNQMKIGFRAIEKRTLPTAVTGLALFVSIIYVTVNGVGASFLSKDAFRIMLKPADPIAQSLLAKDFSIGMTMEKFAETLAVKQFGPAYTTLAPSMKKQALTEVLTQLRAQATGYGISFKNSDTVSDAFYSYFVKQFDKIPVQYRSMIPYIILLLTFLTVKSLGAILRWLIIAPTYVLYQFLLSAGFARIAMESRSREIIIVG